MSMKKSLDPNKLICITLQMQSLSRIITTFNRRHGLNKLAGDPIMKFIAFILITFIIGKKKIHQHDSATFRCDVAVNQSSSQPASYNSLLRDVL